MLFLVITLSIIFKVANIDQSKNVSFLKCRPQFSTETVELPMQHTVLFSVLHVTDNRLEELSNSIFNELFPKVPKGSLC